MESKFSALLLSNDSGALATIDKVLEAHAVQRQVCNNAVAALDALKKSRVDLMVLDLDMAGTRELLQIRPEDRPVGAIIAISRDTKAISEELRIKAQYVLAKPFTPELLVRVLKTVYTLIVSSRRSVFRCTVDIAAKVACQEACVKQPAQSGIVVNISQMGLCLQSSNPMPKGATAFVDFTLPGSQVQLHIIGKVMWSNDGQTGVEFRFLPPIEFQALRDWLGGRFPMAPELTLIAAGSFQGTQTTTV